MLKGIIAGLLFSLACIISGAWGQELNLVVVPGFHALPADKIDEVYSVASHYFKELGVTFRLNQSALSENPCWLLHNITLREVEIKCFANYAREKGYVKKRRRVLTFFMLPPYATVSDNKITFWVAGMAERIGGVVAVGNAEEFNQDGVLRLQESGTILAHESSHLMGAYHINNRPNLMHFNALVYVQPGKFLPVLRPTKRAAQRFLIKMRR